MLDHLGGKLLSRIRTAARLEGARRRSSELVLELKQAEGDLKIEAYASKNEIILAMREADAWSTHWHFAPTWNDVYGDVPDRRWTSLAVDFMAEVLEAEVRVRATYHGNRLQKVATEVVDRDGDCLVSTSTGALTARALNFWAKRRVEERTARFSV